MRRLLAFAALAAALAFGCVPAHAQNAICPDVATGDSSQRCANTKFVQAAIAGGGIPLAQNFIMVGSAGGFAVGVPLSGDCTIVSAGTITCAKVNSTSVPTNAAADQVLLTTASATGSWASVPNCTGGALAYATASHTFSCVAVVANAVPVFDTVAAATAATIPASGTATIYIRGFSVAGDAGGGFWTRSVSMPVPTARFQSADGAWWSPALANGVFPMEIFGGQCGGSGFDNTPALNKYNSFITTNGQLPLRFQPCLYSFNTAPSAFNPVSPYFEGTGINGTVLNRNYSGTAGVGFIQISAASGTVIKDLEIAAAAGTTTGDALRFDASTSNGASGSFLNNVTIVGFGTDNFDSMITVDGHLKTAGAIGSRDHNWVALTLFGSKVASLNALSIEGLTWNGGGIYPAGGSSTAPVILNGLTAPMASTSININLAAGGDVQLDQCVRCILRAPAWSNVFNTTNTNLSGVGGNVPGTKQTNWINSNYLAF